MLIVGDCANVQPVLTNIPVIVLLTVVQVHVVGILYSVWYSQVCVLDNFIFVQFLNILL